MKAINYILISLSVLMISCAKEVKTPNSPHELAPSIIGVLDDHALISQGTVKTSYDSEGSFSWVTGDKIAVQLIGKTDTEKRDKWVFSANGTATTTTFSTTNTAYSSDWEIGEYAFYPKQLAAEESPFNLDYNNDSPETVSLPAETGDYLLYGDLLKMVPLIGKKTAVDGSNYTFNFCTATGVLKLNFEDVPNVGNLRVDLISPYPLCGTFTISEDNTILSSNYVSGNTTRTLKPSPEFSSVYIALPISDDTYSTGIPAGMEIILRRENTGQVYSHITTSTPILIERNTITELTVPIKAMGSTVDVTGQATAPHASITISGEEEVAFAISTTKNAAISALNGATWYSANADIDISSLCNPFGSRNLYLAYKVKSGGHVYLKDAIKFYYMSSGMATWIYGSYTVSSPNRYDNTTTDSSFRFEASDNPKKGNVTLTEYDGTVATNKVYGYYDSTIHNNKITFPSSNLWAAKFDGTSYLSNGSTSYDIVFYTPCSGTAYLLSKWMGFKNGSTWTSLVYGSDGATTGDAINNYKGIRN